MPFATCQDGTRLYYQCQGQGPALLLLAGQSGDHREWDRVAADFATHFQVIVWDYRGRADRAAMAALAGPPAGRRRSAT